MLIRNDSATAQSVPSLGLDVAPGGIADVPDAVGVELAAREDWSEAKPKPLPAKSTAAPSKESK